MSGETIVITRPKGDEKTLADALQSRGFHVIQEPLTDIFLRHTERQALEHALLSEPDAVIVTSRHGAAALSLLSDLRDAYLICVGHATAQAAENMGFTRIGTAGGNVDRLIEMIAQGYDAGSRFLYASGIHVSHDLEAALAGYGMEVERLALYEALAATQLSDTLLEQLRREQIDAITFFSPRAAQVFVHLLAQAGALDTSQTLQAFCLSEAIAAPLAKNAFKAIHIADEPTLASLCRSVNNTFLR